MPPPLANLHALELPPLAIENPNAVEVLRVWAVQGAKQQFILKTTWKNPEAWGLLLVDLARQVARAYQEEGLDDNLVLNRIRQAFDAEWSYPTEA